jgi:hypothetical protein
MMNDQSLSQKKNAALLFDFLFLFLNVQFCFLLIRNQARFEPWALFVIPLVLLPVYSFLSTRFIRQTIGQYLFNIERVKKNSHTPITRLYDWIFESELRLKGTRQSTFLGKVTLLGASFLSTGVFLVLLNGDPVTKRWKVVTLPLNEEFLKNASITYLPFSYLLTPVPTHFGKEPLLWELPYLKGPPKSFLGKIEIQWSEEWQNRLAFSGPLSFAKNRTPEELVACLQKLLGCRSDRQELFSRHLKIGNDFGEIFETTIFKVENPHLKPNETPTLLYVRGLSRKDPKRTLEVALILNPNLAFQAVSLDQRESPLKAENSLFFRSLLSNIRLTGDLAAPRTWVNEKLSAFSPKGRPTLLEITEAQKLLLSKLSVDPSQLEPFYHLFRFSEMEYRDSLNTKNLISTARARRLMNAIVLYSRDVAPADQKSKEMEQILAQIEKGK